MLKLLIRFWGWSLTGIALAAVLIVMFGPGLLVFVDNHLFHDAKSNTSDARKSTTDLITGLVAIAAIGLTIYSTLENQKQNRETMQASRESMTTEAFNKSVDQLGNTSSITTRVGGIQGLARVLEYTTSNRDYWAVLDTLSAFVRENASSMKSEEERRGLPSDIQTAIDVLTRRKSIVKRAEPDAAIDLRDTDLRGAWVRGGNLGYTYLGRTNLDGADLQQAVFDNLDLDHTSFRNANLQKVSFEKVNFLGPIIIDRANMREARVKKEHWPDCFQGEPTEHPIIVS